MAGGPRLWIGALAVAALVGAVSVVAAATTQYWGAPSALALPGNAVSRGGEYAYLNDVTCVSLGYCTGVGAFKNASGDYLALAATEANGVWGAATQVQGPSDVATTSDPNTFFNSVSCWSVGNCVAVGSYADDQTHPAQQAMYAVQTNGSWGEAVKLTLPSNPVPDTASGAQYANLVGVSCTGPNDCVATGSYKDNSSPANKVAMIATDAAGLWSASAPQLPSSATGTSQSSALNGVDCTSASSCVAVGEFTNSSPNQEPMLDTYSSGSWHQATALSLPATATTTAHDQQAFLDDVACSDSGDCEAVGGYDLAAGSPVPLSISESAGSWQTGVAVQLPSGGGTQADYFTGFSGVSCPATGTCEAAGWYLDGAGNEEPMLATQQSASWTQASESTLPADKNATRTGDETYAWWGGIDCVTTVECVLGGTYLNSSGANVPMVEISGPALSVSTPSLAGGALGSPYSQALVASGGIGGFTWSLASGTLPPGLSLNTSTGVITGTPTTSGAFSFTVSVSNAGPPAQTATTGQLSITVGAPSVGAVFTSPTKVSVTVACSAPAGATCTGTASLSSIEHLVSGKVVAVTASHRRKKRKRSVTINDGSAAFSVAGGSTETVVIQLSSAARKLVAKGHKLPASLTLTVTGASLPVSTSNITIHARKHKHRKHKR